MWAYIYACGSKRVKPITKFQCSGIAMGSLPYILAHFIFKNIIISVPF